jgi:hypothetical protein
VSFRRKRGETKHDGAVADILRCMRHRIGMVSIWFGIPGDYSMGDASAKEGEGRAQAQTQALQ